MCLHVIMKRELTRLETCVSKIESRREFKRVSRLFTGRYISSLPTRSRKKRVFSHVTTGFDVKRFVQGVFVIPRTKISDEILIRFDY
jgi:hypothetical protein